MSSFQTNPFGPNTFYSFLKKYRGNHSDKLKVIVVDSEYECPNGIIGLNRDILMKLIRMFGRDTALLKANRGINGDPFLSKEKIRMIIGISLTFYLWTKTRAFYLAREYPSAQPPRQSVFLRLCHKIEVRAGPSKKEKDRNIRALMGMCLEHAAWKGHADFISERVKDVKTATELEKCITPPHHADASGGFNGFPRFAPGGHEGRDNRGFGFGFGRRRVLHSHGRGRGRGFGGGGSPGEASAGRTDAAASALTAEDEANVQQIIDATGEGREVVVSTYLACERNVQTTAEVVLGQLDF